ncbi:MAG: TrkA C-terminal domain-containing protein [Planctomycetota bacterium]
MLALGTFLLIVVLSLIVERAAILALVQTGMTRQAARFQARSAWTGTGFTTGEAEQIVAHPMRRQILQMLMMVRGAGFVTMIAALVTGIQADDDVEWLTAEIKLAGGIGGMIAIYLVAMSPVFDAVIAPVTKWGLRRFTKLQVADYHSMFHLYEDYEVHEVTIKPGEWIEGRTLTDLDLPEEGVLVLAIERPGGTFIGAPRGGYRIASGDKLVIYGREATLRELQRRQRDAEGERERAESVARHEREKEEQDRHAIEA